MTRITFCPGAIYGRIKGWTPVVRIMRNGRMVASTVGPAYRLRYLAEDHAWRAAHSVVRQLASDYPDCEFRVSGPGAPSDPVTVDPEPETRWDDLRAWAAAL